MNEDILKIKNLSKTFYSKGISINAVNDVSFNVPKGKTVGLVGESGCGKTTLGRCIVRGISANQGSVEYHKEEGEVYDFLSLDKKSLKRMRKDIQMIFQDPYSSLDPRMTVFDIIAEPLKANLRLSRNELEMKVKDIAQKTGLNVSYLRRYPHAFSGGQRQRIGIARALVLLPRVIVCDEAVSALDVSIQAQIINLLKDLQKDMELSYIFISHDLSVVEYISDQIGVMYFGRLVEFADVDELYNKPLHPYTESLLSAVPIADPTISLKRIPLKGEIPNPSNPPSGCHFHPRCKYMIPICANESPPLKKISKNHSAACHRADEIQLKGIKLINE